MNGLNKSRGGIVTSIILWIILLSLIGYFVWKNILKVPCSSPIEYSIGKVDPRFGVPETEFKNDIAQASAVWGKSIGKTLFEYNPEGELEINLVYDDRQKITQAEKVLKSDIDKTSGVADSVKQEYKSLEDRYAISRKLYESEVSGFNQAQSDYNREVEYWNARGGAPESEYEKLTALKGALVQRRNILEAERVRMNGIGDQINALIDKYNLLIGHINSNVSAINNDGLAGTQFEEGVYISDESGERINIYQFETKAYLIRVLAHELGHSINLDHNSNPHSIMNPVNREESLRLSAEDLASLKTECQIEQ